MLFLCFLEMSGILQKQGLPPAQTEKPSQTDQQTPACPEDQNQYHGHPEDHQKNL